MAVTNGWGQGVINNIIEWGRGATNNVIGWGSVYDSSESGETSLNAAANLLLDQYSGAAAAYSVRKLSSSYSGSALRVRRSSDNAEQDIGFDGENLDTSALEDFVNARGYLLDNHSGAAAAYSVRKLSSTYSGSALRVRRSSDNAEQDIGFLGNDLDTATMESFVGAGDGFVVTWYDQSGNGNNAIQATASRQPQIVSSGSVNLDNGKPSVVFNIDDLATIFAYPTQQYQNTFYVANSSGAGRVVDTRGTGLSATGWFHRFESAGQVSAIDDGSNPILSTTNVSRSGQTLASIFAFGGSGSTIDEYTNSSLVDSVSDATSRNFNRGGIMRIGANLNGADRQHLIGDLQEIILYNTDQSANRAGIETNINDYYSIYP